MGKLLQLETSAARVAASAPNPMLEAKSNVLEGVSKGHPAPKGT